MAKIEFIHADEHEFIRIADLAGPPENRAEWARGYSEEEIQGMASRPLFGDADHLELFEAQLTPGTLGETHAHVEDEIIYVLEGSLEVGRTSYPAGSAVYVPAWTLYGFRAGPDGLRMLNFRKAKAARGYVTRDEFMAERTAAEQEDAV